MKTPPPQNIRLTITVTPEVHEVFSRLAAASGGSLGKTMGEWLSDTVEAAGHMADLLQRARSAPRLVAQELHAYALGAADETGDLLNKMRTEGLMGPLSDAARAARAAGPATPRPVIRGGKSPGKTRKNK